MSARVKVRPAVVGDVVHVDTFGPVVWRVVEVDGGEVRLRKIYASSRVELGGIAVVRLTVAGGVLQ